MKLNNFSAGPSKIPIEVLSKIAEDINNYKDLGYSVLEISHRSKVFEDIVNTAKKKLVDILKIPDDYDIFFIQGGATFQNTFIPANKRSLSNNVSFLISITYIMARNSSNYCERLGQKRSSFNFSLLIFLMICLMLICLERMV